MFLELPDGQWISNTSTDLIADAFLSLDTFEDMSNKLSDVFVEYEGLSHTLTTFIDDNRNGEVSQEDLKSQFKLLVAKIKEWLLKFWNMIKNFFRWVFKTEQKLKDAISAELKRLENRKPGRSKFGPRLDKPIREGDVLGVRVVIVGILEVDKYVDKFQFLEAAKYAENELKKQGRSIYDSAGSSYKLPPKSEWDKDVWRRLKIEIKQHCTLTVLENMYAVMTHLRTTGHPDFQITSNNFTNLRDTLNANDGNSLKITETEVSAFSLDTFEKVTREIRNFTAMIATVEKELAELYQYLLAFDGDYETPQDQVVSVDFELLAKLRKESIEISKGGWTLNKVKYGLDKCLLLLEHLPAIKKVEPALKKVMEANFTRTLENTDNPEKSANEMRIALKTALTLVGKNLQTVIDSIFFLGRGMLKISHGIQIVEEQD